jgi:hypothetical protein
VISNKLMHPLSAHAENLANLGDTYEIQLLTARHLPTVPLTYDNKGGS